MNSKLKTIRDLSEIECDQVSGGFLNGRLPPGTPVGGPVPSPIGPGHLSTGGGGGGGGAGGGQPPVFGPPALQP